MSALGWRRVWEADLIAGDHEELRLLLAGSFPAHAARGVYAQRSWAAARPELRLLGLDPQAGGRPVAHVGVTRRFVRVGGQPVLVADTGMVAVHPSWRGLGLGRALLARHLELLAGLDVPFGFLTCVAGTVPYYEGGGWRRLPQVAVTQLSPQGCAAQTSTPAAMVLPVSRGMSAWPAGDVVRDGYEV